MALPGIILLAHGSRGEQVEGARLKEITGLLQARLGDGHTVQPAFLQFNQPDLEAAVASLFHRGLKDIIVLPYFLFEGAHFNRHIPDELQRLAEKYPGVNIRMARGLGVDRRILDVLAERLDEIAPQPGGRSDRPRGGVAQGFSPAGGVAHGLSLAGGVAHGFSPAGGVAHGFSPAGGVAQGFSPAGGVADAPDPVGGLRGRDTGRSQTNAIEQQSFAMISALYPGLDGSPEGLVRKRVLHATANPDLSSRLAFHPRAVESGLAALKAGKPIIADVRMVAVGINRSLTSDLGSDILCAMEQASPGQKTEAGSTRTAAGIRQLAPQLAGATVVIGNAPTALLAVLDLLDEGAAPPALIVGVPVGFIKAAEAKARLAGTNIPYITLPGRLGGSPIAVACINALLRMAAAGGPSPIQPGSLSTGELSGPPVHRYKSVEEENL